MKKLICVALLIIAMASMLTACGKFTCDICGKEKSGKKHTDELLGQEIVYCDDCHKGLSDLADAFK